MAEPVDSLLMMEPRSTDEVDASPMPSAEDSPQDDDADAQLLAVASADGGSHLYNMGHTRRGLFIIINNKTFQKCTRMGERKGTDADAANLYKTFKGLGFDVEILKDLTCKQMLEKMTKLAEYDFTDSDCFACAILSHGDAGMVYGIDGIIAIDSLVAPFKGDRCGSLAGKPKMFFIQACRGTQLDPGVYAVDGPAKPQKVYRIQTNVDFLFAYSTAPGHYAWRNPKRGSWFVQALCNELQEHGHDKELMEVLTRTNHAVAYKFESDCDNQSMNRKKQIPSIVSQLTKQLYFAHK